MRHTTRELNDDFNDSLLKFSKNENSGLRHFTFLNIYVYIYIYSPHKQNDSFLLRGYIIISEHKLRDILHSGFLSKPRKTYITSEQSVSISNNTYVYVY